MLIEEQAIRTAAGNPNGRIHLDVPRLKELEAQPKPKIILHTALRTATELSARRLQSFNPEARAFQVGECITDFSPLQKLPAFQRFDAELRQALASIF